MNFADGRFSRFLALLVKEMRQIKRDKRLLWLLLFPPTIQLVVYASVLNPIVTNLPLVVVDEAQTQASHQLIDAVTQSHAFKLVKYCSSQKEADSMLSRGKATLQINIPPDFQRELNNERPAEVQLIVNAVDAFSSGLASSYALQAIANFRTDPSDLLPRSGQQLAAFPLLLCSLYSCRNKHRHLACHSDKESATGTVAIFLREFADHSVVGFDCTV